MTAQHPGQVEDGTDGIPGAMPNVIPQRVKSNPVVRFAVVAIRIFNEQRIMGLSQQIAYNVLFSVAPLLIFLTAFGSMVLQRTNADMENPVQPILDWTNEHLPEEAAEFLKQPIETALSVDPGFVLSIGGLLALWAAKNAIASVMVGLNAAYGIRQNRSFIPQNLVAILLTVGLAIAIVISAGLQLISTTVGQDIAESLSLGTQWADVVVRLQTPVTVVMVIIVVLILHRFGPTFSGPFLWYLPGAVVTVVGVIVATFGLQIYFQISEGFAAAYGVFGALLAFMFWLFVVAMVILIGGVVNATLFEIYPPAMRALEDFRKVEDDRRERADDVKQRVRDAFASKTETEESPPTTS